MNDPTKHIKVNSSSLVSLKAELSRKELEVLQGKTHPKLPVPKNIKNKGKDGGVNSGVAARAARDIEEQIKENTIVQNARDILEKKSKVYDAMTKKLVEDDEENEHYLVDFQQKYLDNVEDVAKRVSTRGKEDIEVHNSSLRTVGLDSKEETGASEVGPIHYANVRQNEIRTHGVGFYQLSGESAKRKEQFELLNKLRNQTEEQKARKERVKEKRAAQMQQRLAKMRQRRGLPEPEPESEEEKTLPATPDPAPLTRDDSWRQAAPITREWDKGKQVVQTYQQKRREERNPEFAPVYGHDIQTHLEPTNDHLPNKESSKSEDSTKVLKLAHKIAPAKPMTSKSKMTAEDIAKTLKSLRSQTEGQLEEKKDIVNTASENSSLPKAHPPMDLADIPLPSSTPLVSAVPASSKDTQVEHVQSGEVSEEQTQIAAQVGAMRQAGYFQHPPPVAALTTHVEQEQLQYDGTVATPTTMGQQSTPTSATTSSSSQVIPDAAPPLTTAGTKRQLAPQPAHYSSAPSKVQVRQVPYERVDIHSLPANLPAPPSDTNLPRYKAQDGTPIPRSRVERGERRDLMHMWNQQYKFKENPPSS